MLVLIGCYLPVVVIGSMGIYLFQCESLCWEKLMTLKGFPFL